MSNPIKREGGRVNCSDQRQGTRAELARVSVRYAVGTEEVVDGEVLNLSMGGMFLRATRPLPPGTQLGFEIRIVGEDGPMRGTGEVRWTRDAPTAAGAPSGMGLCFVGLDENACDVISRLVVVREQTMLGLGPDEEGELSTRAPEPSVPMDLVRRKEPRPMQLVKKKSVPVDVDIDDDNDDSFAEWADEPTSLSAIAIDGGRRPPVPRAPSIAPFLVAAAAMIIAGLPGDNGPPTFGSGGSDDATAIVFLPPLPPVPASTALAVAPPPPPPAPPSTVAALPSATPAPSATATPTVARASRSKGAHPQPAR
jgi:uncharacterized protein (TIGR02266 family)